MMLSRTAAAITLRHGASRALSQAVSDPLATGDAAAPVTRLDSVLESASTSCLGKKYNPGMPLDLDWVS